MQNSISVSGQLIRLLLPPLAAVSIFGCGGSQSPESAGVAPQADTPAPASAATGPAIVSYRADRIIVGDGRVIEPGIIAVADSEIVSVAQADASQGNGGDGTVVDLSGMTIMPAIVDAHVHLSTDRAGILNDLRQRARVGVSAALSLGADGPEVPLEIRNEKIPGAARYLSAGRGITSPEPGRSEVPHWVTTEAEARQAVRDEAARNVDLIKIWVDDRDGQYEKLSEPLYSAVIDEAHANGMKATAHIFALEDAKGLLRAGIDAFAHGVRDQDIDDEFVALVRERPEVVLVPNLPSRGVPTELGWLEGIMPADQLAALQANNVENPDVQEFFGIQSRNLGRLAEAGMTIAMGTDGNTFWAPHVEMEDMVASGMSPADVIVAATRNSAAFLGLEDTGVLEAGRRADFIVLEANPLEDITNTRSIVDVYLAGERVAR